MNKNKILMVLVIVLMAISLASPLLFYMNYVDHPQVQSAGGGAVASVSVFVPAECGDGMCELDETCSSCPSDCGECVYECGNGICDTNETCSTCPEDCGECTDPGTGGSSGSGGGSSGFTPALRVNFAFSPGVIQEQFFPGGSLVQLINVTNLGIEPIEVSLSTVNLDGMVFLDKEILYLKYGEVEQFEALISIPVNTEANVYLGDIIGKADNIEKSLPFVLRIIEEDAPFRISINISESSKIVKPGEVVKASINIFSNLEAAGAGFDSSVRTREEQIILEDFRTLDLDIGQNIFDGEFRVPIDTEPDYYLYYVNLTYGGKSYLDAVTFRVESPEEVPGLFESDYLAYGSIALFIVLLSAIFYIMKKKKHKKKAPVKKTKKAKIEKPKIDLVKTTISKLNSLKRKTDQKYGYNSIESFFRIIKSFLTQYYSIKRNSTFDEIKNTLESRDIKMKGKVIGFIDKIAHLPYTYSLISKKKFIKILDESISLLKFYKK